MPETTIVTAEQRSRRTIRLITLQFLASLFGITFLSWYAVGVQSQALQDLKAQAAFLQTGSQHRAMISRIARKSLEFASPVNGRTVVDQTALRSDLSASRDALLKLQPELQRFITLRHSESERRSSEIARVYDESIKSIIFHVDELLRTEGEQARLQKAEQISSDADAGLQQYRLVLDELVDRVSLNSDLVGLIGLRAGIGVTVISLIIVFGVVIPTSRKLWTALHDSVEIARERELANAHLAEVQESLREQNETLAEQQARLQESLDFAEHQTKLNHMASLRFQSLFQGLPVGCLTFDHEGRIIEWNHAMSALFEVETSSVLYRFLPEVFTNMHDPSQFLRLQELVKQGENYAETDWELCLASGEHKIVRVAAFPLRSHDGQIQGGIANILDVTERRRIEKEIKEANRQLAALASQDGLTGLMNHITLQKNLELAFASKRSIAVVLLDVDHFKLYNDSFGHPAGDEVLRMVAGLLTKLVPATDIAARYGGEEFAIAFFDADKDAAYQLTEQIRAEFELIDWPNRPVTASFGLSFSSPGTKSHRELIESADRALYKSKAAGRNRVSIADDPAIAA